MATRLTPISFRQERASIGKSPRQTQRANTARNSLGFVNGAETEVAGICLLSNFSKRATTHSARGFVTGAHLARGNLSFQVRILSPIFPSKTFWDPFPESWSSQLTLYSVCEPADPSINKLGFVSLVNCNKWQCNVDSVHDIGMSQESVSVRWEVERLGCPRRL